MTDDTEILRAIVDWRRCEMEHLKPASYNHQLITAARDRVNLLRQGVRGEDGAIHLPVMDEIDSIKTSIEDITHCRTGKIVRMAVAEARMGKEDLFGKDTWSEQDTKLCQAVRGAVTEYLREMEGCCDEQN